MQVSGAGAEPEHEGMDRGQAGADRGRAGAERGRAAGLVVLALGAALHLLFLISLRTQWLNPLFVEAVGSFGQAGDYFGIYQAGDNLTQGRSIYLRGGRPGGTSRSVPYYYFYRYLPPTAYLAAVPALFLNPWPSYWIWVAITEGMLLLLVVTLLRLRSPPAPARMALAGIALGFTPVYLEQWMGQFSFLMAAFLWATFWPEIRNLRATGRPGEVVGPPTPLERIEEPARGILRRRDLWGWSASIALKSFPVLFALPLLRVRHWRRVYLAAAMVALICLPYFLTRPEEIPQFIGLNLGGLSPQPLPGAYGLATLVRALSWHLPESWVKQTIALGPLDIYRGNVPVFVSSLGLGLASLVMTWRMARSRVAEVMALWVLTFFLIYEDVWEYHYVMCLPVVWLLAARGDWRWPLFWGTLLALPTPFVFFRGAWNGRPVEEWPWWIVVVHYGSKVLPTLGLYLLAARRSRLERRDGAPGTA